MTLTLSRAAATVVEDAVRGLGVGLGTASMADIARAAGISRATLYRSFPTRDALLRGVVTVAIDRLAEGIRAADLERIDVPEGIARVTRSFVVTGSAYATLAGLDVKDAESEADLDARVGIPIRALLARGVADGSLRDDVPVETHYTALAALLEVGFRLTSERGVAAETAAATVTTLFLDGAAVSR
jgi:TetR/AcrR family transcriptional regulator, mexCD-oprJ operon repressor